LREIYVHHNAFKHGLTKEDIVFALQNYIRMQYRAEPNGDQAIAVGVDKKGRLVELVCTEKQFGILIYHAKTPPTTKMLLELGMVRR